jgi:hypothetical protein
MSERIRKRNSDERLPLKFDDKTTVMGPVDEVGDKAPRKSLGVFMESYIGEFTNEEKRLIYLKGYEDNSYEETAKMMKISKTKAREMGKDLHKEISNVSIERNIEIKRYFQATRRDIESTNAMMLGEIHKALRKKITNCKELEDMPLEKLAKLQEIYSEKCSSNGEIYTGKSLPKIKFPSIDETISVEY